MRAVPTTAFLILLALQSAVIADEAERDSPELTARAQGVGKACYLEVLRHDSTLAGQLQLEVISDTDGKPVEVNVNSDSIRDEQLRDCILTHARTWRFPASRTDTKRTYTLDLRRPESDAASAKQGDNSERQDAQAHKDAQEQSRCAGGNFLLFAAKIRYQGFDPSRSRGCVLVIQAATVLNATADGWTIVGGSEPLGAIRAKRLFVNGGLILNRRVVYLRMAQFRSVIGTVGALPTFRMLEQ